VAHQVVGLLVLHLVRPRGDHLGALAACSWYSRCSSCPQPSRFCSLGHPQLVLISWGSGALARCSACGSPTSPTCHRSLIVCMYGLVLAIAGLLRKLGVGGVADITAPAGTPVELYVTVFAMRSRSPPFEPRGSSLPPAALLPGRLRWRTPASTPPALMPRRTSSPTAARAARASTRQTAPCVISSARRLSRPAPSPSGSTSPTTGRCSPRAQPRRRGRSLEPTQPEHLPSSPSDRAIRARRPHVN